MMKTILRRASCSLFAFLLLTSISKAQSYGTGAVTIIQIGCQTVNTICFVAFSGPAVGPPGCNTNQVRWDSVNTPNGKEALAQLTAAYVAGKQVSFSIDNKCFAEFPNYPQMDYYIISG
jgi:hypothetical protein